MRFGVVLHAGEVDHHAGLVPDHPAVVPRGYGDDIAKTELELGAVFHPNYLPARNDVAKMRRLTAIGTGDRLDVIRPAPSGLERGFAHDTTPDPDKLDTTFVGHRPNFIRRSKALLLQLHGVAPSQSIDPTGPYAEPSPPVNHRAARAADSDLNLTSAGLALTKAQTTTLLHERRSLSPCR